MPFKLKLQILLLKDYINFYHYLLMFRITLAHKALFSQAKPNPFQRIAKQLSVGSKKVTYYDLPALNDPRLDRLPFSVRVLLESAVRNCDEFEVKSQDVENILNWE